MTNPKSLRVLMVVTAVAVGVCLSVDLGAQRRGGRRNRAPEPSVRLQSITGVRCEFPASASGKWTDAQPTATVESKSTFEVRFSQIETQEGTANAVGLGAPAEVTVRLVGGNLHFLDIRQNGDLAVTTVFDEETRNGRLKAVHSRSQYAGTGTGPVVAQYYGDCVASSE